MVVKFRSLSFRSSDKTMAVDIKNRSHYHDDIIRKSDIIV